MRKKSGSFLFNKVFFFHQFLCYVIDFIYERKKRVTQIYHHRSKTKLQKNYYCKERHIDGFFIQFYSRKINESLTFHLHLGAFLLLALFPEIQSKYSIYDVGRCHLFVHFKNINCSQTTK